MSAIITKMRLSRRAVLRGLGATMALPVLDAMTSAFTAAAQTPLRRLGAIYVPNGMNIWNWTPKTEGSGFEFSPILKPLEPFRKNLVVLSGLPTRRPTGGWERERVTIPAPRRRT